MDNKRIIYTNDEGGVSVVIPAPNTGLTIEQLADKVVPTGKVFDIVDVVDVPSERTFRNAWGKEGKAIKVDLVKAKGIAHEVRRGKRAEEFKPLDVEATIPSMTVQAEAKRQVIRDKYDAIQVDIDATTDVAVLTTIVKTLKGEL